MNVHRISVGLMATNCYIAYSGEHAVVIDPGFEPEKIINEATLLGVKIEYILLTHGHFDHIIAVNAVKKATGCPVAAGRDERERMKSAELSEATAMRMAKKFTPVAADVELSDGDEICVADMKFKFIETPGHTGGSMCIICDDVIFSGDTLFRDVCGRCDLRGGDYGEMLSSLRRLYELPGDYRVFPGHGEETTLERERRENPYMAEAMKR